MVSIVDTLKENIVRRLEEVKENVKNGDDVCTQLDHAIQDIEVMCDDLNTTVRDLINSLW